MAKVTWRERFALKALAFFTRIKSLADIDHDGDLDSDDLLKIYTSVKEWLAIEGPKIAIWTIMSPGQRIDAAVGALRHTFPHAKESLWILLEALAFAALSLGLL